MNLLPGYDRWLDAPIERELEARADDEEEVDDPCEVLVDLDIRCGKPITRTVREPYTPAAFEIDCCDECAESFIQQGYLSK